MYLTIQGRGNMKNCLNCGLQNTDEAIFCHNCGSKFEQSPPPPPNQDFYAPPEPYQAQNPPSGQAVAELKALGSSPMFLAAAIALSLTALFAIISAFTGNIDFSSLFDSYSSVFGYDIWQYSGSLDGVMRSAVTVFSLLSQIPSVLICAGLWMLYASCKKSSGAVSSGGLGMIRVVTIIKLCWFCLITGIVIIFLLFTLVAVNTTGYLNHLEISFANVMLSLALFIIAAITVPTIFYYTKTLKTIKSVSLTARTGAPDSNISMYLVVVNFIIAGFGFIGLVSSLFSNPATNPFTSSTGAQLAVFNIVAWPSWIASAANIAFLALISVLLLQYRSKMRLLAYNVQPYPDS